MSDCRKCAKFEECAVDEDCGLFVDKPMTNADRIRHMSDEELSDIMYPYECVGCPVETKNGKCLREGENCETALLRWLKSPADKEGE